MKIIFKSFLVFIFFVKSIFPDNFPKAQEHLKNAEIYINLKNYQSALAELQLAELEYSKDGYFATRIAILHAYYLKDYPSSLIHFERALQQGGSTIPWTLREYGLALLKTGDPDTSEEFLKQSIELSKANSDLELGYGYLAHLQKLQKRYKESINSASIGYKINPNSNEFYLCDSIVKSNLMLSYSELVLKNYDNSIKYISESEKYITKNNIVFENVKKYELPTQKKIIENRKKLGKIKPIYQNKILALFIESTNVRFTSLNGKIIKGKSSITDEERDSAKFFQEVLREFIESMSNGNYSIIFENLNIQSTLNDIRVSSFGGLDTREPVIESISPNISDIFFKHRNDYDTFAIYWNGDNFSTTANGGGFNYPYVNYQMYGPNRGYISFPTNWNDEVHITGLVHEFFHNIEALTGITPVHGYLSRNFFPNWKGDGELDYYWWHFTNTLPRVFNDSSLKDKAPSWKNLGWLERFPDTSTEDDLKINIKFSNRIGYENLKKSYQLALEAKTFYWEKGDLQSADPLFKEAFFLNPYNPFALRYMGDLENKKGNFTEAYSHFSTLLKIVPDPWVFRTLIYIQQWNLRDYSGAQSTYERYFQKYPSEQTNNIIEYGRLQIDLKNYDFALRIFESGIQSSDTTRIPSVRAQSYFWKGYILGEAKGDTKSALKFIKQSMIEGYNDDFTSFYLKKYNK